MSPFFSKESTLLEIKVFETPNTTFNSVLVVIVELFFKIIKIEISSARLYPLEKLGYPIITVDELISRLLDTKEDSLLCGSLYYVGEVLEKWGNV